ncbi:MAG: hypothetical protein JSV20_04815 [Candidatus Bathyarchaeota archaeon]|nr:MAG: hypothetical protein JSV20_04815 [Candidatus Bathyarchaeota archaeon]
MQIDFHFYAIYAIARAAGFSPDNAHTIAYSSQHTDDAKYEHALEFGNGGRFQQVLSAHKFFDPDAVGKETCYRIWVPFHFLPGNSGIDFYERMLTKANSIIAQRMVEEFLGSNLKPYSLHRLGIILHTYADNWSHQNFMGIRHDMNDVKKIKGKDITKSALEGIKRKVVACWAPKVGHAQAATIPDEPYREWKYEDYKGRSLQISNQERSLDAAQNCYTVLSRFRERFSEFRGSPVLPWQKILEKIGELFSHQGELDDRVKNWQEAISKGTIGFEPNDNDIELTYDDREWFRAAVTVIQKEEEKPSFEKKEGFQMSSWKYFHDAAAFHRFHLLHELLPEYEIICG